MTPPSTADPSEAAGAAPGRPSAATLHGAGPAVALHWLLRVGVAMEFIGHGACGLHTKAAWLPYFHLFGIAPGYAWKLMPWVGAMDISLGLATLIAPRRAILSYMAFWGCFTAVLRPATGEGGWEFIERAYNYGAPFALLYLHGFGARVGGWWGRLGPPALSANRAITLLRVARMIVVLMLIGHGAFGAVMGKANLLPFYRAAGLGAFGWPLESVRWWIGVLEMGLGFGALWAQAPAFFLFVLAWKLGSELLYPLSGASLACWEVVERGASYAVPLVVFTLLRARPLAPPLPAPAPAAVPARLAA